MSTSMLVLHPPLLILDVPETHRVVQAGSGEPFSAPGEARSEYWALFRAESFSAADKPATTRSGLLYVICFQNTAQQRQ